MSLPDSGTVQAILSLYLFFNLFRLFSYIPQILILKKEQSAAKAISLLTYWMWVGANFTTGIYASFVAQDFWLSITSYGNTVFCLAIALMIHYKRWKYADHDDLQLRTVQLRAPTCSNK